MKHAIMSKWFAKFLWAYFVMPQMRVKTLEENHIPNSMHETLSIE